MSLSALSLPEAIDAQVTTLGNGLVVIVREDHSAPVVSAQAWCRAGSIDEGRWLGAGLSHVLEHMLFKGTASRAAGRIDQEVQDAGGYMNAYTSFDRTVYWINVPSTGARVAVDILCDIMQHATLPEEELVKELDVIRREMDMCHDDPGRRSSRRLFETAYLRSPYRYPVIGIPDIFNTLTREDVLGYYREKYAPNNLFLVVVGDVKPQEVLSQIGETLGGAVARPVPVVPLPDEPRQTAPREQVEEAPIELGHVHVSWHIPGLLHPDIPALDMASIILGAGRSSRLYREVREKAGLVHSADAWTYSPGTLGLFGLSAVLDGDKFDDARAALLREVDRLRESVPGEAEMLKCVKQIAAGTLASRKTMQGQAQELGGSWMMTGDLGYSIRYLEAIRRVTAAEVRRCAEVYLRPENRTCYGLLPAGSRPQVRLTAREATQSPVTRLVFPNGLRVLVKEDPRLPFVEFRAVFRGGVLAETEADNGITGLMTKMLLKGAGDRTAEQISTEIESVGGSVDAYAGNNSFGVTLEVLEGDFNLGMELLADLVLRPTFPEVELERERESQLATIRAQRDQLLQLAGRAVKRGLFGPAGYGLDASGTEESVQSLGLEQLRAFQRRWMAPSNAVFAIYGHVRVEQVRRAVEQAFGGWVVSETGPSHLWNPPVPKAPMRITEVRDKKQAVVVMGFRGTSLLERDRHALEMIQEACSDLGSRLFVRIRDELGLAYFVGAQNFPGLVPGYFSFYAGTEPGRAGQVTEEFLGEVNKLRNEGLTPEELRRCKAKLIGQKKIARQDLGSYAMTTALDELYGLGYAHCDAEDVAYEAVTHEDILQAARRYLLSEAHVLCIAGPGEGDAGRPGGEDAA